MNGLEYGEKNDLIYNYETNKLSYLVEYIVLHLIIVSKPLLLNDFKPPIKFGGRFIYSP